MGYKNAALLVTSFIDAGYELVVVDFVFEHPRHIARFLAAAPTSVPIHLFTLWAPLEVVLAREAARPNRERLGERVDRCWETPQHNLDRLGVTVPADAASPEALAQEIRTAAELGTGQVRPQSSSS